MADQINELDEIQQIINNYKPDITKNEFSKLCYEIFISNEKGKLLMGYLYNYYVLQPFTDLLGSDPEIDTNKILAKAVKRDLIQSLLLRAQQFENAINK